MPEYLDRWGLNYEELLATQREQLDALRMVLTKEAFNELEFYCDTMNCPAPPPDGMSADKFHSSRLHSVPRGAELTQWVLKMGQQRQLL